MMTNKIPRGVIYNIEKAERSFIWGDQEGRKENACYRLEFNDSA